MPNDLLDLNSDEISELFIQELKNLDKLKCSHPSIMCCEGIYTRE
jgi:hypothetical protein